MTKKQIAAITIYILGIICVVYFLLMALIGGRHVSNPQAMLPATDFEANVFILGIGCIPMVASCIFFIHSFKIKKWKRIPVLIPGFITAIPFIIGIGLLLYMLVMGFYESMLYLIGRN